MPAETRSRDRKKVQALPDPEPMLSFAEAVKTRKQPGGHAEAAQRSATSSSSVRQPAIVSRQRSASVWSVYGVPVASV